MKSIFFLFLLSSCIARNIPIKGTYPSPPFEGISTNNREIVWDKLIDLFVQKGLPIKLIDEASGLIVSEESELIWSHEDREGQLFEDRAHVVLMKTSVLGITGRPYKVTGEWNIRIKPEGEKTKININLINIRPYAMDTLGNVRNYGRVFSVGNVVKSTGKFEQTIFEIINLPAESSPAGSPK
jgi:hypothetical protein